MEHAVARIGTVIALRDSQKLTPLTGASVYLVHFSVCLVVAGSALISTSATGQGWRPTARLRADVRVDDNPFLLDTLHRARLAAPSPSDSVNGRFREMESASDVITTPRLELGVEGRGLSGRTMVVTAGVKYELNSRNVARRHSELQLEIAQSLRRGGEIRFTADWRPSYFHKNYLADAVDLDANGNISSSERVYAAGTSHEVDLELRYRQRLLKATRHRLLGLSAELRGGYLDRRYDAPFPARGRKGPDVGGGVAIQMGPTVTLGLDYSVASLGGTPAPAILILDENRFGVDFNGNLTATDSNARAAVLVDYSRVERQLDASFRAAAGAATVIVEYGRRSRHFDSVQPYDVVNRGRRDVLKEITVDTELRVSRDARLTLGVRRGAQTTNRAGDPASAGDVADYSRHVWWAGLRYRF